MLLNNMTVRCSQIMIQFGTQGRRLTGALFYVATVTSRRLA